MTADVGEYWLETLQCPVCGWGMTHIDEVAVVGRGEDGSAVGGRMDRFCLYHDESVDNVPMGTRVGDGRRHRIALLGWCEEGHRFAIVYTQHKGETFIEAVGLPPTSDAPVSEP